MSSLGEEYDRSVLLGSFLFRVSIAFFLTILVEFVSTRSIPYLPLTIPYLLYAVLDTTWPLLDRVGRAIGGTIVLILFAITIAQYRVFVFVGAMLALVLILFFGFFRVEPRIVRFVNWLPVLGSPHTEFNQTGDDSPITVVYTPETPVDRNEGERDGEDNGLVCPDCGLALNKYLVGEFCPDCGRPVDDIVPATHYRMVDTVNYDEDT